MNEELMERLERLCGCLERSLHVETDKTFEQTMARYNDMSSKAAADSLQNSTMQQQSFAAAMLEQVKKISP